MLEQASGNYRKRALRVRSGMGSVSQEANIAAHRSQQVLDYHNSYFDVEMNRVSIRTVQQINDLAFYRRGNRWIDSRLIGKKLSAKPSRQIDFGSKEFSELIERLAKEHRNGCLSLHGEVLLEIDGKDVLISAP